MGSWPPLWPSAGLPSPSPSTTSRDPSSGPLCRSTFLAGTTISLIVLALAGQFGTSDLVGAAWLVLPVMLGGALSGPLRGPLDRGWLAPAVYILSSAAAVVLLIRSLA